MAFSNQQTPAEPNRLGTADSGAVRPLHGVSLSFDRAILGIPAEEDEFTRGLTFFFDPSTGQPSVHSMSQGSEDPDEIPQYEPSRSSHTTSSRKLLTPQSVSDISGGLHPRMVSSSSVASSDGGVDSPCPPSVSARASPATSKAASSSTHLSMVGTYAAIPMSSAVDSPFRQNFGPPEDMTDPRSVIDVTPSDFKCLEEIMSLQGPSHLHSPGQASDPMDLDDDPISQSLDPHPLELAQRSNSSCEVLHQRTRSGTKAPAIRAPKQRRNHPGHHRQTTKDAIAKTKYMRHIGVCLPCLVNHEPCAPGKPCPRCSKARIQKTPCVRHKLSEAVLFRKGALSFPEGLPDIKGWVSKRNVPLQLYNVGPANPSASPHSRPRFMVKCREFSPILGVRSFKSWTKGASKIDIHLPNFAMTKAQYSEAGKSLDALVEREYYHLVDELATGQEEGLVSMTLREAVRQAEKCWPIKGALKLSILSRLASKSFNIFGQETLGIRPEEDEQCPYYNRVPIPPLLDAQIDFLLMEKMKYLKKAVLSGLRKMIAGQGREAWYMIYLTMLVLLLNLESVYQNQCRQIQRYQERPYHQRTMMESWVYSAKNLIDHFRAVCRGQIPLNMDWNKGDQDAAEVDDRSLEFIDHLKELTRSRDDELRKRSNASPDTPLVWISALFVP